MSFIDWIKSYYEDALSAASVVLDEQQQQQATPGVHLSVWGSWSACERARLEALKAAGCQEVILNVNTVQGGGRVWRWQNSKGAVLARAERVIEAGMAVAWMPWVWTYPQWMETAGKELRQLDEALTARTGQGARMVQLDWEGHAEHSTRRQVASTGATTAGVVDRALTTLCSQLPDHLQLGITPLYFRRDGGDEAIKWSREIGPRLWSIRELLTQAYSVWLQGTDAKAQATHAPEYQPGILQRRAWDNYAPFAPYLDEVGIGLNGWALRREGPSVPDELELSAEEAMDRAVEACLEVGAERVAFWALHLFDSGKGVEAERFELVLEAMRRLSGEGGRVLKLERSPDPHLEPHPGLHVYWDRRQTAPTLAEGGAPKGYVLPKMRGVSVAGVVPVAKAVLARWRSEGWPLGTVIPATLRGRRLAVVVQRHPWTRRNGRRVPYNGPGATVFVEAA